jgi:hypothetical protein
MLTFNEYLADRFPEFYEEAKKTGLLGKVLDLAKKMPLTAAALASGATGVGLSKYAAKQAEIDYHPIEIKQAKEKLPPLKPSKNKIVGKIEDAGMV